MRRLFVALLAVTLGLPALAAARPMRVVATIPDLAALAQAVGGDHVEVQSLSLPTQDPHFVDARPNLALALNRADLLLVAGLGLESGWLPTLQTGARNASIQTGAEGHLDASTYAQLKEVPRARVDRSMGDIHPGGNPHYLTDPRNGLRVARAIADRLARLDPEHAEIFRSRLESFEAEARRRIERWEREMAPHRGARVVTYHASWVYVIDWLGLEHLASIEPKPGIPPSPAHVGRLLVRMRQQPPAVILQEAWYPDATARLLGEKTGTPVLVVPGGTDFSRGETYLQHLDHLVRDLRESLTRGRPAEAHR